MWRERVGCAEKYLWLIHRKATKRGRKSQRKWRTECKATEERQHHGLDGWDDVTYQQHYIIYYRSCIVCSERYFDDRRFGRVGGLWEGSNERGWIASDAVRVRSVWQHHEHWSVLTTRDLSTTCHFHLRHHTEILSGPCGQCIMGEPAFLSEEFSNLVDPDLELVTTSGFGKNGAISVLQVSFIEFTQTTTVTLRGILNSMIINECIQL